MSAPARIIAVVIVLAVGGWLLSAAVDRAYVGPRARLRDAVAEAEARAARAAAALDDAPRVDAALRALDARALGGDVEAVDHRLRTRLNRIAEAAGLEGAAVGTGAPAPRRSPARAALPRRGAWSALRDEIDLVELGGWVSGEGSLETALGLVDRIEAEPWLKRVDHVKLDPKGDGARVAVTVRLATAFRPGRDLGPPAAGAYDEGRQARFAALVEANPFRLPPPAPPAPPAPPPAPPSAPPAVAWADWVLTGVADGPSGPEAWLRNRANGAARRLVVGEALESAVLDSIVGDRAGFRAGDRAVRVRIGEDLGSLAPVKE